MKDPEVSPFLEPLTALQRLIELHDQKGVIIGGIASSILGKPRLTNDIDAVFLLSVDEVGAFLQLAQSEEIHPRIEDSLEFALKNRILLLQHTPSETEIDISMGILPFEIEMIERSTLTDITSSLQLRLPTPEDLIISKAVAHRAKDLEDIDHLILRFKDLDAQRIQHWLEAFAEVLESPDIWSDIRDKFGS